MGILFCYEVFIFPAPFSSTLNVEGEKKKKDQNDVDKILEDYANACSTQKTGDGARSAMCQARRRLRRSDETPQR